MQHMYLVQRGHIDEVNPENEHKFLGFVDLDYMGSSEFEWGAIPRAFTRLMRAYEAENVELKCFESIVNTNGVPMWAICKKGMAEDIEKELRKYVYDRSDTEIDKYHLKEYNSIPEHCGTRHLFDMGYEYVTSKKGPQYVVRDNFWWDIENDFLCFFGAKDRADLVMSHFDSEYRNWWLALTKEDRAEKIRKSEL